MPSTKKNLLEEFVELEKAQKFQEIIERKIDKNALSELEYFKILFIKAKAKFITGNFEEAKKLISIIINWAENNDAELYIQAKVLEANCCTITGQLILAQDIFEDIFFEHPEVVSFPYYPNIIMNYGHTLFYQGKMLEANEQYAKALHIAKERELPQDKIKNNLALTFTQLGNYKQAIELLEEVIAEKEKISDFHGWVIATVNQGSIYSYQGDYKKAHNNVDIAIKFAEEKLYMRELAGAHSVKGLIYLKEKKVLEAQEQLEKARAILEQINVKDILPEVLVRLGFIYFLLGELKEAKEIVKEIEKIAEEQESSLFLVWGTCLETMIEFENEQDEEVLKMIEKILELSLEFNIIPTYLQALILAIYIYSALEKFEEAKEVAIKGLKIIEEKNLKHVQTQLYIILGYLYGILHEEELVEKYMDKISKIKVEKKMYTEDLDNLAKILKRKHANEKREKDLVENLLDLLQRINPWF